MQKQLTSKSWQKLAKCRHCSANFCQKMPWHLCFSRSPDLDCEVFDRPSRRPARFGSSVRGCLGLGVRVSKIGEISKILQIFCGLVLGCIKTKLCKKIIQNMRLTAFFKLYKICILLHRCNLKILAKDRFEKVSTFCENSANKLQMLQNLQIFVKF